MVGSHSADVNERSLGRRESRGSGHNPRRFLRIELDYSYGTPHVDDYEE
jgi:hypothetical protein